MALTWLSKSANPRMSGNKISRSSLNCASIERWPIPSRSGPEPLGEPWFEEVSGIGEMGTSDPSSTLATRTGGKLQNWVVDTWTRQHPESSWTGKPPRTFEQEMAWAKMATDPPGCRPSSSCAAWAELDERWQVPTEGDYAWPITLQREHQTWRHGADASWIHHVRKKKRNGSPSARVIVQEFEDTSDKEFAWCIHSCANPLTKSQALTSLTSTVANRWMDTRASHFSVFRGPL